MTANDVAVTIARQLGPQCLGLIGATNLSTGVVLESGFPYLKFQVARNEKKITHVVVYYNPCDDTYNLDFYSRPERLEDLREDSFTPVSSCKGVAVYHLYDILEEHTGLYCSLYKRS
ncbi:MAG: hypothetical protein IM631_12550 [Cytophagales bacterium]|nr:hypothetical protein [Cytophagales bacterium]MCA6382345.1 hypothetical protein [Cytophagales bacterium]